MARGQVASVAVAAWIALAGCSRDPSHATADGAHPALAPSTQAPKGTLALGAPIASPFVSLSDIAKSPAKYEDQVVTTGGKVTAVCQAMGCWMELVDEASQAHVKMHGHTFFVPKTAAGHVARVQATVLHAAGAACEDSPPPAAGPVAKVELDATGVELDPVSNL